MRVTWFKKKLGASAVDWRGSSTACTVIALLCAEKSSTIPEGGAVSHVQVKPLLVESIKEGTLIHRAANNYRSNEAPSLPATIAFLGSKGICIQEGRSLDFDFNNGSALRLAIEELLADWTRSDLNARHRVAYLVLVTSVHTALLISDGAMVTLVGAHIRCYSGALIATTTVAEVDKLCNMYWKLLVEALPWGVQEGSPGIAQMKIIYFPKELNVQ